MANNYYLVFAGTNYYLSGGGALQTEYAGSSTPWTAQTTTPYEVAMNDTTGERWTPLSPEPKVVWGGGSPALPLYTDYDNVTETIPIQLRATTFDNAVTLLQQLRKILSAASVLTPITFAVQPNGSTNTGYYEVYSARIQENARFLNDEAGLSSAHAVIRAAITWVRSPFAAGLSTGESVLSSASFTARGTSSPDDVEAFAASPSGDLIYVGQPMNITVTPTTSSQSIFTLYIGSIYSRAYTTTGTATKSKSFGGANPTVTASAAFDASAALTQRGLKARVIGSFTDVTANCEVQIRLKPGGDTSTSAPYLYTLKGTSDVASGTTLIDFGDFPLDLVYRRPYQDTTWDFSVVWTIDAVATGTATATMNSLEYILYWDWARIDAPSGLSALTANSEYILLDTYQEQTGAVLIPAGDGQAYVMTSANKIKGVCTVRGTLPRLFTGGSLYANWERSGYIYTSTDTATITARQSPLWQTLRGGD